MILATWLVLVGLAVGAALAGRLDLALLLAGAKTLLVGLEFMELRHAARAHAATFVLGVASVTAALLLLAG